MDPNYHETKSSHGNDFQPTIRWIEATNSLRIDACSGTLRGHAFVLGMDTYTPTFPIQGRGLAVSIYLVRDPNTGVIEYVVDEREKGVGLLSPKEAGYDVLSHVAWFDFRPGDVAPFRFNACRIVPVDEHANDRSRRSR